MPPIRSANLFRGDVFDELTHRAIVTDVDDQLTDQQMEPINLGEAFARGCESNDSFSKFSRYKTAIRDFGVNSMIINAGKTQRSH